MLDVDAGLVALIALLLGTTKMRISEQRSADKARRSYLLRFPSDLSSTQVEAWLQAISGSLRSSGFALDGRPAIVFELLATPKGLSHLLLVNHGQADYVVSQLRSLAPGMSVTPTRRPAAKWHRVVELGLAKPTHVFTTAKPDVLSASLLASVQGLRDGEAVIVQQVVSTARHLKPPAEPRSPEGVEKAVGWMLGASQLSEHELKEIRTKLGQTNFHVVIRIGARARSEKRGLTLINHVRTALESGGNTHNRLRPRRRSESRLQLALREAKTPLLFPARLTAAELSGLVAWPLGQPHVAGLSQGHTRELPPSGQVARSGRVVAISNYPGAQRPLAMSADDGLKHVHVLGPTGVGKTTLLINMLAQDIRAGHGVIVLESKGDLYRAALGAIPDDRLDDVIVIDMAKDAAQIVGFNILAQGRPGMIRDELVAVFEYLYNDTRGVYTKEVLYHGLSTLLSQPGLTFVDLTALLAPRSKEQERWRAEVIKGVRDPEIRQFWDRFDAQPRPAQERYVQPVLDRIWQLNARPEIRNVIGQSHSTFSMRDVVSQGKILLINLAGLGQQAATLVGTLFVNALWGAVRQGRGRRHNFLYVDEFQDFLTLPISPESMLAQARSFGLGMVLAHQHLDQLSREMRSAVMANARSKVVFQTNRDDAYAFAREFGPSVSETDFINLGNYEVITRLVTPTGVSPPMTGRTPPPMRGFGLQGEVLKRSALRYGRPRDEVLREIAERTSVAESKPSKLPRLGFEDWQP